MMINTTPSRYPSRASSETSQIHQILDEGIFCTISFNRNGIPHQIPTGYCRLGDKIYIHGSSKSEFVSSIIGKKVSFSVTLMDGLVLAPTAFDHSFNYRSVIGFCEPVEVIDENEKLNLFDKFTDRYIPGRIADVGSPTKEQISITKIASLDLSNASAKTREGDMGSKVSGQAVWCGVIPSKLIYNKPIIDSQLAEMETPDYIKSLVDGNN